MPELPEVETTLRGLAPHLTGARIAAVTIRQPQLRWPIPVELPHILPGQRIRHLARRAKYLLLHCDEGGLIVHLGMSGSLRILLQDHPPEKHDHFELLLDDGKRLRLRDPRRFGAVLWHPGDPAQHPLLAHLGVEPLGDNFDTDFLFQATRNRKTALKLLLMDHHLLVGVGNIYANEALFRARLHPQIPALLLSREACARLVAEIRATLTEAIAQGGSSLRDFVNPQGQSGYFQQSYWVYGRSEQPCRVCHSPILTLRQGQRATFYCPHCQAAAR